MLMFSYIAKNIKSYLKAFLITRLQIDFHFPHRRSRKLPLKTNFNGRKKFSLMGNWIAEKLNSSNQCMKLLITWIQTRGLHVSGPGPYSARQIRWFLQWAGLGQQRRIMFSNWPDRQKRNEFFNSWTRLLKKEDE